MFGRLLPSVLLRLHLGRLCSDLCQPRCCLGRAKTGVGICSMGYTQARTHHEVNGPVVMAGILGIYATIVTAIFIQRSDSAHMQSPKRITPTSRPTHTWPLASAGTSVRWYLLSKTGGRIGDWDCRRRGSAGRHPAGGDFCGV